jgi:hypothetical protein
MSVRHLFIPRQGRIGRLFVDVYHGLVASNAIVVQHGLVARSNSDWLVKVIERKTLRVQKAVLSFDQVLGDKRCRRVAIIAGRDRMMTRLQPPIVMIVHDVDSWRSRACVHVRLRRRAGRLRARLGCLVFYPATADSMEFQGGPFAQKPEIPIGVAVAAMRKYELPVQRGPDPKPGE